MAEIKLWMSDKVHPQQINIKFLQMMINRMVVGAHRHARVADRKGVDIQALKRLEKAIGRYKETGNTECMVDAANYCMIEFMNPSLPGAEFKHADSRGYTRSVE